jgi:hypothetical protein
VYGESIVLRHVDGDVAEISGTPFLGFHMICAHVDVVYILVRGELIANHLSHNHDLADGSYSCRERFKKGN